MFSKFPLHRVNCLHFTKVIQPGDMTWRPRLQGYEKLRWIPFAGTSHLRPSACTAGMHPSLGMSLSDGTTCPRSWRGTPRLFLQLSPWRENPSCDSSVPAPCSVVCGHVTFGPMECEQQQSRIWAEDFQGQSISAQPCLLAWGRWKHTSSGTASAAEWGQWASPLLTLTPRVAERWIEYLLWRHWGLEIACDKERFLRQTRLQRARQILSKLLQHRRERPQHNAEVSSACNKDSWGLTASGPSEGVSGWKITERDFIRYHGWGSS